MTVPGIVTLLSDLDIVDGFVAAIKGAILTVDPTTTIIDVSHQVPRGDVTEAAFQLAVVWPVFPAGSVHVVVVDSQSEPATRLIAVEIGNQMFVVPDNGVLTLAMGIGLPTGAVVLDRRERWREGGGGVFPGRDILGPVAALLAGRRASLSDVGSAVNLDSLVRLPWLPVADAEDRVHAPIVSVDRYGNCRTLITRRHLPDDLSRVLVRCGDVTVRGIQRSYADVALGKTLALMGSHGGLEIAVRGGSAATSWDLQRGDEVVVALGT